MKKIKFAAIIFVIPFIIAFNPSGKNKGNKMELKSAPENIIAYVKKIVKDVSYRKSSDQSDWEIAKTGTPLEDGGQVKTESKSLALVKLIDNSGLLRVRENSILRVYGEKKNKVMNKNINIEKGLIGFEVNKQSGEEEFKFTTPTVVASIRGTSGYILYSEDSTFTMYLNSGYAGFTGARGCDSLSAGNAIVVSSNGSCVVRKQTAEDVNTFNSTNRVNVKKINIKTNDGKVEIDFYEKGNE